MSELDQVIFEPREEQKAEHETIEIKDQNPPIIEENNEKKEEEKEKQKKVGIKREI